MKHYIFVVYVFFTFSVFAQEVCAPHNFVNQNCTLIWRASDTCSYNFDMLVSLVRISGRFENIEILDSSIYCKLIPIEKKPGDYGIKYGQTPPIFFHSKIGGKVVIDYKPGKYRMTIKDIVFMGQTSPLSAAYSEDSYNSLAFNKRCQLKTGFVNNCNLCFNAMFTPLAKFSKPKSSW